MKLILFIVSSLFLLHPSNALFSSTSSSIILNVQNFDTVMANPTVPFFIKVYAPWCGYCKRLAPTWQQLAQDLKGKVNIAVINGIEDRQLALRFALNGFPSLYFTEDGVNYIYYDGGRQYEELKQFALGGFKTVQKQKYAHLKDPPSFLSLLYSDLRDILIKADKKINIYFEERGWDRPSEESKVIAVVVPSILLFIVLLRCFMKQIRKMNQITFQKKNN